MLLVKNYEEQQSRATTKLYYRSRGSRRRPVESRKLEQLINGLVVS